MADERNRRRDWLRRRLRYPAGAGPRGSDWADSDGADSDGADSDGADSDGDVSDTAEADAAVPDGAGAAEAVPAGARTAEAVPAGARTAEARTDRVVWDPVVSTVLLEFVGLAFSAIVALVGWLFGWLPDLVLVALVTSMVALAPAAELCGTGARPRRRAVIAALLVQATVTVLAAAAVTWAVPAVAARGAGLVVGHLVALPAGVAVLARLLGRQAKG